VRNRVVNGRVTSAHAKVDKAGVSYTRESREPCGGSYYDRSWWCDTIRAITWGRRCHSWLFGADVDGTALSSAQACGIEGAELEAAVGQAQAQKLGN